MPAPKYPTRISEEQGSINAANTKPRNFSGDADNPRSVADVIGIFADEPLWDEVMAEVEAFRKLQNVATSPQLSAK